LVSAFSFIHSHNIVLDYLRYLLICILLLVIFFLHIFTWLKFNCICTESTLLLPLLNIKLKKTSCKISSNLFVEMKKTSCKIDERRIIEENEIYFQHLFLSILYLPSFSLPLIVSFPVSPWSEADLNWCSSVNLPVQSWIGTHFLSSTVKYTIYQVLSKCQHSLLGRSVPTVLILGHWTSMDLIIVSRGVQAVGSVKTEIIIYI
jgi:hypothetical protein